MASNPLLPSTQVQLVLLLPLFLGLILRQSLSVHQRSLDQLMAVRQKEEVLSSARQRSLAVTPLSPRQLLWAPAEGVVDAGTCEG